MHGGEDGETAIWMLGGHEERERGVLARVYNIFGDHVRYTETATARVCSLFLPLSTSKLLR